MNVYRPNTVTLLDKSVWHGLKREEMWVLNRVSTVALAPVLYEEIRAEAVPRKNRPSKRSDRLASVAAKGSSDRTFALPTAWKLIEAELTGQRIQFFHGVPVDMPFVFDKESGGIILDQQEEIDDLQRWSSDRKATAEELEAAKLWRAQLESRLRPGDEEESSESETDDAIHTVHEGTMEEVSRAVEYKEGIANGLALLGFSRSKTRDLVSRWGMERGRRIQRDAPYTFHGIALELFMRNVVKKWPWRSRCRPTSCTSTISHSAMFLRRTTRRRRATPRCG